MTGRRVAIVGAAIALLTATGAAHHVTAGKRAAFPPEDDVVYLPRTDALRVGAVGHRELVADLLFLRAILYFSTQLTGARNYEWLDRHLDVITELDPHFHAPYIFGTRATVYNGLTITNEMVMSSTHFAEQGLKAFPNDWELAFTEGCNWLFEMKTNDPKEKEAWRRKGGALIRRASLVGGGPVWLSSLAARIMTEEGEADGAIRYLEEQYLAAQDDKTRQELHNLLLAKRAANVDRLTRARDEFNAAWQRTLPYATADLFVLTGEAPSPRLDLPFLTTDEVLAASEREDREAEARWRGTAPPGRAFAGGAEPSQGSAFEARARK